jgi:polyribonucleotide nucleotidyltransferase
MLEADGREATEDVTYGAIEYGLQQMQPVIDLLKKIETEMGKAKLTLPVVEETAEQQAAKTAGEAVATAHFSEVKETLFGPGNKRERHQRQLTAMSALKAKFTEEQANQVSYAVTSCPTRVRSADTKLT